MNFKPDIPSVAEPKTGDSIKIPEGKLAAWESVGSLNLNETNLEFFAGQSDKYHLDLAFTDGDDLKVPLIESKINFNNQTGHHEYEFQPSERELLESLQSQQGFNQVFDNYLRKLTEKEELFLQTLDSESHVHKIRAHHFTIAGKERNIELIQQTQAGDCVLANLINTTSLESSHGNISLTIKEARELAIRLRRERGADANDILLPDSDLENSDAFYLFYNKLGTRTPRQTDFMTVDGNLPENQLEDKAKEVVERTSECSTNICSVGMQSHSISIKWVPDAQEGDKEFIVIDPLNSNGLEFFDVSEILDYIKSGVKGRHSDSNFFCFID